MGIIHDACVWKMETYRLPDFRTLDVAYVELMIRRSVLLSYQNAEPLRDERKYFFSCGPTLPYL